MLSVTSSPEDWLQALELPEAAERPIWVPSGTSRRVRIRCVERLAVLMSGLRRDTRSFAYVEWPRAFPQTWAQTAPAGGGFIVEVNDGVEMRGCDAPCTRRAFRGSPGTYPPPDEDDPRYKTVRYPPFDGEIFTAMEGAELIWTQIHGRRLPPGVALTMRHFGSKERSEFNCGEF